MGSWGHSGLQMCGLPTAAGWEWSVHVGAVSTGSEVGRREGSSSHGWGNRGQSCPQLPGVRETKLSWRSDPASHKASNQPTKKFLCIWYSNEEYLQVILYKTSLALPRANDLFCFVALVFQKAFCKCNKAAAGNSMQKHMGRFHGCNHRTIELWGLEWTSGAPSVQALQSSSLQQLHTKAEPHSHGPEGTSAWDFPQSPQLYGTQADASNGFWEGVRLWALWEQCHFHFQSLGMVLLYIAQCIVLDELFIRLRNVVCEFGLNSAFLLLLIREGLFPWDFSRDVTLYEYFYQKKKCCLKIWVSKFCLLLQTVM